MGHVQNNLRIGQPGSTDVIGNVARGTGPVAETAGIETGGGAAPSTGSEGGGDEGGIDETMGGSGSGRSG